MSCLSSSEAFAEGNKVAFLQTVGIWYAWENF